MQSPKKLKGSQMGRVCGGVEEKDGSEEFFAGFKGFEDIMLLAFGPLGSHFQKHSHSSIQERNQLSYKVSWLGKKVRNVILIQVSEAS